MSKEQCPPPSNYFVTKQHQNYDVTHQYQNYDVTNQHQSLHESLTCNDGVMYNSGFNQTFKIPDIFDNCSYSQVKIYFKSLNSRWQTIISFEIY